MENTLNVRQMQAVLLRLVKSEKFVKILHAEYIKGIKESRARKAAAAAAAAAGNPTP